MTTTKQPPAHGSQARYKGSTTRPPCRCRRCVRGWTQAGQKRHLKRLAGKPASLTREEVAAVVTHIRVCTNAGMSQCLIARRAGVAQSTISRLLSRDDAGCLRQQGERILAVRPGDFDDRSDRPVIGTMRRIRGLYYAGHGPLAIREHAPITLTLITEIAGEQYSSVSAATEAAVRHACAVLAATPGTSRQARTRAIRESWAPLGAWDDIDDPAAVPDWTGHCGTDRGYWIHQRQHLSTCARCEQAHADWLAEHAHLTVQELNQARFRARNAAVSREADLAADGRELMQVSGLDAEQAAARLGVTRNHLQQALLRNPETAEEVAA
ncbi:hypothetical protein ACWD48_19795 [Streptomyces sp. NPDC002519]